MASLSGHHVHYRTVTTLVVIGSCVRAFLCFQHNPLDYLWSDPLRHWLNGGRFPGGGYTSAGDPILYQVYIFLLRTISHDNRLLIALASALLSVAMPWTYYRAARNFGLRKAPALWLWALIAWTPSLFAIYHFTMEETLLLLVEGIALWMTARYLREGGREAFLTAVFFWTLAVLTKPTVVPLAGICLLWCWWKRSPSLRQVGMAAGLVFLMLLPQAIRSEVALGFVAPLGNPWLIRIMHRSGAKTTYFHYYPRPTQYLNFRSVATEHQLPFTSPSCDERPLSPLSDWAIRRASANSTVTISINFAHGARDWENTYASLDVGWVEWLAQWRENIVLFLFAPSWPESIMPEWDGRLVYQGRWMWPPLIVFLLLCNFRQFSKGRFELIPLATTLFTLFLGLQNVALSEGRYHKPLEPLLLFNLVWIVGKKSLATAKLETETSDGISLVSEADASDDRERERSDPRAPEDHQLAGAPGQKPGGVTPQVQAVISRVNIISVIGHYSYPYALISRPNICALIPGRLPLARPSANRDG